MCSEHPESDGSSSGGGIISWIRGHGCCCQTMLLVGLAIFVLSRIRRMFFGSSGDKDKIFADDKVESWSDDDDFIELDEKKRNAVLKQAFSPEKVPKELDAVFIGSGIGSLSTALLLARTGKKVLVLEQHDRAGGCCHTFVEKGYEFDTGIHYIGGMGVGDSNRVLMDQLTGGRLKWDRLDDVYDVTVLGKGANQRQYNVRAGSKEIWENELIRQFPGEEAAIKKFSAACSAVNKSFTAGVVVKFLPYWVFKILSSIGVFSWLTDYVKWNRTTVKDFVNGLTKNNDLRMVFQYLFGDYGSQPEAASFSILGLIHRHYWRGAYYPRGGASEIPYHITKEIQKAGGAVLVRANVVAILLDPSNSQAIGVKVEKGSSTHEVYAPMIVSGAGFENTFKKLLPKDASRGLTLVKEAEAHVSKSTSCFQAFFGFDLTDSEDAEEISNLIPQQNMWIYKSVDDIGKVMTEYMSLSKEGVQDADLPFVFIGFPSKKDSTYSKRHPGKVACTILTLSNYDWFKEWEGTTVNKRGDEYEGIKNTIGQRLLDVVLEHFPQLKDKLELTIYGTGLSTNYYLGQTSGELYGLDHDAKRFSLEAQAALRPESGIKGLYLTGQDIMSCGFAGALAAGVLTASKIIGRNLFSELENYAKAVKAAGKGSPASKKSE